MFRILIFVAASFLVIFTGCKKDNPLVPVDRDTHYDYILTGEWIATQWDGHTYTYIGNWITSLSGNSLTVNKDTWKFFKYDTIRPATSNSPMNVNYYFYMKNPLVDRYDTLFINLNDNGWGNIQENKLEIISFDIHYDLDRVK